MACEVRGDGATSGRPEASGETWVTSEPTPNGHLSSSTRTKRAARRSRQQERRRTFRRAGKTDVRHTETVVDAKIISELDNKVDEISDTLLIAFSESTELIGNSLEECYTKTAGLCTQIQEHVQDANKGQQECIAQQRNI